MSTAFLTGGLFGFLIFLFVLAVVRAYRRDMREDRPLYPPNQGSGGKRR